MRNQEMIDALVAWIRKVTPPDVQVLIPVSGGSDSALCFSLYNQAIPGRVEGVFIGTALRAKAWFEQQGTMYYSDLQTNGPSPEVERWAHFLTLGIQQNRALVGSRNRTEDTLGTFSHASKVCSFLPLANLWKSQVMELCDFVGVPGEIIASSRRADPACGRPKRMADIPFEVVDAFLCSKLGLPCPVLAPTGSADQLHYLEQVYAGQSYKKHLPFKGPSTLPPVGY